MIFGASEAVRADENKPVTEGNAVTVHVIEKDSEENLPDTSTVTLRRMNLCIRPTSLS